MQNFDVRIQESIVIGMNDRLPSHELPVGVYQLLDNVLVGNNKIEKRPGSSGSVSVGTSTPMLGGSAFEPNGGTKVQIICVDGSANSQLYRSTDGITFTILGAATLTAGAQVNFIQASNILLGFNGVDALDYDGTNVTFNRVGLPRGKFGVWFHNFLFIAGASGFPNRIYWSALGDPLDFSSPNSSPTGSGFVDVNANDGDFITGLAEFNDSLIVFKQYSTHVISGWSGDSFTTTTAAGQNTTTFAIGYGTPSHRSIVAAGSNLYYLSFIGGIPSIRKFERTIYGVIRDVGTVSREIEGTMSDLNVPSLSKASAIFDGKYLYWALPSGSSSVNNLVIVHYPEKKTQTSQGPMQSWVKWSSGITAVNFFVSTISGQSRLYWTSGSISGKVFVLDSSVSTDNNNPIVLEVRTRDFVSDLARKTKWIYVYFKYDTGSDGILDVNARIDKVISFTNQEGVSLRGNSPGLGPTGTFTLGVSKLGGAGIGKHRTTLAHMTGTLLGLQMRESSIHPLGLYDFEYYGQRKGLRVN